MNIYNTLERMRITRMKRYVFAREIVLRYLKRVCRRSNAKSNWNLITRSVLPSYPIKRYIYKTSVFRVCASYDREENKAFTYRRYTSKRQTKLEVSSRRLSITLQINCSDWITNSRRFGCSGSTLLKLFETHGTYGSIIIVKFCNEQN